MQEVELEDVLREMMDPDQEQLTEEGGEAEEVEEEEGGEEVEEEVME